MDVREFIRGNGGRRGRRHLVIPTVFGVPLAVPQSTMTFTEFSPGIYRIAVVRASGVAPGELLTRQSRGGVTVLPPSVQPDT